MKHLKTLLGSGISRVPVFLLLSGLFQAANAGVVKGVIKDKQDNEPLVGAIVIASEKNKGTTADVDGNYKLELPAGTYMLTARYMGYRTLVKESVEVPEVGEVFLDFLMESDTQSLNEVTVTAVARRNTESAQVLEQKRSLVVQTGVSAQQIARTQD